MYHNNNVGKLKIHLCPTLNGQVLTLPGAASQDVFHNAFHHITQIVPEVVGTENQVISNLSFLLNQSSVTKMQS